MDHLLATCFMLVSYFAYSSTLKIGLTRSPDMSVDLQRIEDKTLHSNCYVNYTSIKFVFSVYWKFSSTLVAMLWVIAITWKSLYYKPVCCSYPTSGYPLIKMQTENNFFLQVTNDQILFGLCSCHSGTGRSLGKPNSHCNTKRKQVTNIMRRKCQEFIFCALHQSTCNTAV